SWHAGWYFQPLASLLEKKGLKEILYHDCSEEIQNWAIPQLQDQPVAPLLEPITCHYSTDKQHLRTYLLCEDDRDVDPQAQRDMAKECPSKVVIMKTGHFPFLSQPEKIAEQIIA
ncbi:MAG TPA: alpha/beta hydrolase, partial [Chlamydiales bacterium]|nr:alpha/beta hydrolase [Chlamydiales bacterium]